MTQTPASTAPKPVPDAPLYRECPACGYISAEKGFVAGTRRCPHCQAAGDSRRTFPAERIRRIDERIRRYHDEGEHEVVVILVATFLETLLEDMLARIMAAEGASVKLRAGVLDTQRSVGQRIGKLFPTLTGEQFEVAAEKASLAEFPQRWRRLRAAPAGPTRWCWDGADGRALGAWAGRGAWVGRLGDGGGRGAAGGRGRAGGFQD